MDGFDLSTRDISIKDHRFICKVIAIQSGKNFLILCLVQQLVIEPKGVLNRY